MDHKPKIEKCGNTLANEVTKARNELHNIRKCIHGLKAQHKKDVMKIENLLKPATDLTGHNNTSHEESKIHEASKTNIYQMKPIGFVKSLHGQKNGTPRQGMISSLSRARVTIEKDIYNNPNHSLEGLQEFSHIWLMYLFHQNDSHGSHAKVSPPRLDGVKLGIFSTRSPHRPNPIGLTLAKLEKVEGDALLLSGVDMIDGTPVIDIKPYIPQYDCPQSTIETTAIVSKEKDLISQRCYDTQEKSPNLRQKDSNLLENIQGKFMNMSECVNIDSEPNIFRRQGNLSSDTMVVEEIFSKSTVNETQNKSTVHKIQVDYPVHEVLNKPFISTKTHEEGRINVSVPNWIENPPSSSLKVIFNPTAENQIKCFATDTENPDFRLTYLRDYQELKSALSTVLAEDPRSIYRRRKCSDRLYYFTVDSAHITACFLNDVVEVLRVSPLINKSP